MPRILIELAAKRYSQPRKRQKQEETPQDMQVRTDLVRSYDSVGTPVFLISRLNSPAYTYPCQRFATALTDDDA